MEKNPIQDQSRMFAHSDGHLRGGSHELNTRNSERVGQEKGLTGRCGANYLPKGWQRAHRAECLKNTQAASEQMDKIMILTADSSQIKLIQYLKGSSTLFRKSN